MSVQASAYLRYAQKRIPGTRGVRRRSKRVANTARGAYRTRGAGAPSSRRPSAAEGALPRLRCPVKPRTLTLPTGSSAPPDISQPVPPNPASASAPNTDPTQNRTNRRSVDTENPRRSVANYSTAGGFTYAPLRAHPQTANQPATGWRAGRGGTSYASRVGFT